VKTLPANGAGSTAVVRGVGNTTGVIVRGANGSTGIAVVEVYALN
jgi:hypothetical protein